VHDGLLEVAVAEVGPDDGVEPELEVVRARGGVLAGDVLDGGVPLEQEEPAGLVRELDEGVVVAVLADGGWKYLSAGFWDADEDAVGASMERTVWW
jgi:hypothetical protein